MATISIKCSHISDGTLPPVCVRCGHVAATRKFGWVADRKAASWYLSRGMKVWGLLLFWAVILWKQHVRVEPHGREAGLPLCKRHLQYWPRRAWFVVGGFVLLVLLFALMYITDPDTSATYHHHKDGIFTILAGIWFLLYLPGFVLVHMSSMRVIRHDGQRVTMVGAGRKFEAALKESYPEYAAEKKPTHLQELKQLFSDYAR